MAPCSNPGPTSKNGLLRRKHLTMKTWIKRTLIAMTGALALGATVAACAHRNHHG